MGLTIGGPNKSVHFSHGLFLIADGPVAFNINDFPGTAKDAGRPAGQQRKAPITWAGRFRKLASVLGHSTEERRVLENAQAHHTNVNSA